MLGERDYAQSTPDHVRLLHGLLGFISEVGKQLTTLTVSQSPRPPPPPISYVAMSEQQRPDAMPADLSSFNIADLVKTRHNARLYNEVQNLKRLINELVDYQLAHPKKPKPASREDIDHEKKAKQEIEKREKYIRAQLSIIKTLYRQSVLKVREEKAKTSDDRAVNDALILGLHNLKYEEQSLRSEISAAENYEYVLLEVYFA
jgi:THO complex subunit 5